MLPIDIISGLSETLDLEAGHVAADFAAGDVGDEDDFSSQLCGRLKAAAEVFMEARVRSATGDREAPSPPHIRFRARHLKSKGWRSEETRIGADIVMVLDIDLPDQRVTKGLFVQAKVLRPGAVMKNQEWIRLRRQCNQMLGLTPACFVLMYSEESIVPFSASGIVSIPRNAVWNMPRYPLRWVFTDFLVSWIGDRRISGTDGRSLTALLDLWGIPDGLALQFYSNPDAPDRWGSEDEAGDQ